jgi:hypothetical protein
MMGRKKVEIRGIMGSTFYIGKCRIRMHLGHRISPCPLPTSVPSACMAQWETAANSEHKYYEQFILHRVPAAVHPRNSCGSKGKGEATDGGELGSDLKRIGF